MEHQQCLPIQVFNVTCPVTKYIPHLLGLWFLMQYSLVIFKRNNSFFGINMSVDNCGYVCKYATECKGIIVK